MNNTFIAVLLLAVSVNSYATESYLSVEKYLEVATANRLDDFTYKLSSANPPKVPNIYGVIISKNNNCHTIFVLERTVKGLVLTDQSPHFLCVDRANVEFIKARNRNRFDIQLYAPAHDFAFRYRYKKIRNRWRLIGSDLEDTRDYMNGVKRITSLNYLTNTCLYKIFKTGKLVTEHKRPAKLPKLFLSGFDPSNTAYTCRDGA